jgi:hypothetical protein
MERMTKKHCLMIAAISGAIAAGPAAAGELGDAVAGTKPILDLRLRYETVEQPLFAKEAETLTLRLRGGFETGEAWETRLLAEFEWVESLVGDYNSTTNGHVAYPVVADPQVVELNRLQLQNSSLPGTTITLGRQRINLDDQRFVGYVGWRQNEQTFDALRIVNTSLPGLTVDMTYLIRVNRIFGHESAQGRFKGDTILMNASYDVGIGTLTAFGYWIDVDTPFAGNASRTIGARFAGKAPIGPVSFAYAASVANQTDYKANPVDYDVMYYMAELTASHSGFMAGGGWESLGGDGTKGFSTPLATLHKFQGWADVFLATPPNGVVDTYVKAGYTVKNVGPFDKIGLTAFHHWFDAEQGSADYGTEFDISLSAAWKDLEFTVKYADYQARSLGTDTRKLWLQIEYKL